MSATHKRCSKCGEVQPLSAFSPDKRYAGGYRHQCKGCVNAYSSTRRATLPKPAPKPLKRVPAGIQAERRREYQREWRRKWRAANPELAREQWRRYARAPHDYLTEWRKEGQSER